MTKKEYLSQIYNLTKVISLKENQLAYFKSKTIYQSNQISDLPHSTDIIKSRLEENLIKQIELEDFIKKQKEEIEKKRNEIILKIERMNNINYEMILEMRYIDLKKWEDVNALI